MDFALTDEQQAIFDMARDFGDARIAPHAAEWEHAGTIPRDLLREAGGLGFGGVYVNEDFGGTGLSRLDATLIFEALSMACPSVASFISIHNMCARMIDAYGTDEMKAERLPAICAMETVLSYCLTEPGSGSDAAALRTRAERTNEGWRLNGTKAFISGGGLFSDRLSRHERGPVPPGPSGISCLPGPERDIAPGLSASARRSAKLGWNSPADGRRSSSMADAPRPGRQPG